jgi:hypothetical protein
MLWEPLIVIDEVHNLLAGSPRKQRVILQLFRHLSNKLKASLVFLGIAEAREAIAGDTQLSRRLDQNGVAAVEGRRRVSESCSRDSSKPAAAAIFGAIGSKLANARAGHGWHHRKSLQHAQRARRGSG